MHRRSKSFLPRHCSETRIFCFWTSHQHLDLSSIQWLEDFLQGYRGAVLIVAHDRYFLDRIVTKVIDISFHRAKVYRGNYTEYAAQRELERITLQIPTRNSSGRLPTSRRSSTS